MDTISKEQRSYTMSRIRGKDTKPELKVRKELHRRGFRYRMNVRALPGTPDIVLRKYKTAIFVNGCFWHGHDGCRLFTRPKSRSDYWAAKIERNRQRDAEDTDLLIKKGWHVITVWECELKPKRFDITMDHLVAQLRANLELKVPEHIVRLSKEEII